MHFCIITLHFHPFFRIIPAPRITPSLAFRTTIVRYPCPNIPLSPAPARQASADPLPLAALAVGFIMAMLDVTVVNVALSDIARSLEVSLSGLVWVIDGYTLAFAAMLLVGGALADRLGARAVYLAGLAVFTLASVACGLAQDGLALVGARLAQGVGASLFVPSSLSLLVHTYADERIRARMVALWSAIVTLSVAAGPLVGGLLIAHFGWRSVFLINVPIGIAGALLTLKLVRPAPARPRALNPASQSLGITALAALCYALIQGPERGWTAPPILLAAALALAAGALLAWREQRAASPLVPRQLLAEPRFLPANALGALASFAVYGQLFLLSLYLQRARGAGPLDTGLQLMPLMLILVLGNLLSGRLSSRRGTRFPMLAGAGLATLATAVAAVDSLALPYWLLMALLVCGNLGAAIAIPAMTATVMQAGGKEHANSAAAILNANRQIGTLLGVAVMGSLLHGLPDWTDSLPAGLAVVAAAYGAAWLIVLRTREAQHPVPR